MESSVVCLTCGAGVDVHHLALGPGRVLVLHHQGDGLHEHGVLGPGLQVGQQHARVRVAVLVELHVHHVPAVGAAALLALERADVLEGSAGDTRSQEPVR